MSLFGSLMQDFERDPIYGAHSRAMNQMNRMMNSFFGGAAPGFPGGGMPGMGMGMNMLESPFGNVHHGQVQQQHEMFPFGMGGGQMMSPFGHMGFPDFNGMMQQHDGNAHSFSSMSVTSISNGPDGRPQVYQASKQTAVAPGGVKETRKAVSDSRSGTKKLSVGRHMGEKAHVREREENLFTGQREENEEFVNLDETDADTFDREWRQRAYGGGRYAHSASMPAVLEADHHHRQQQRNAGRHHQQQQIGYPTRTSESTPSVTIEELPPSDDEEPMPAAAPPCPPQQPPAATASSSRRSPYTRERKPKSKRVKKQHY